jgi:hypothetical protein
VRYQDIGIFGVLPGTPLREHPKLAQGTGRTCHTARCPEAAPVNAYAQTISPMITARARDASR